MKRKLYSTFLAALLSLAWTNVWALEPNAEGIYEIGTAADLVAFSEGISAQTIPNTAKAVLTADLDMSSVENFLPIGPRSAAYKGTFDGQGHILKSLTVNYEGNFGGLFGAVSDGAVIKNLVVDSNSTITVTGAFAGLIGGADAGGTVTLENLGNEATVTCTGANASAIIGVNINGSSTIIIRNCYGTGNISGGSDSALVTGWGGAHMTMNGVWFSGELLSGLLDNYVYRGSGSISNMYSVYGEQGNVTNITADQLKSGEFCYLLNGRDPEGPWRQALGTEDWPRPFGTAKVYAVGRYSCDGVTPIEGTEIQYSNTEGEHIIDPHNYVGGICSVCGAIDLTFVETVDDVYQIGTAADLRWFSAAINAQAIPNTVNAVLTADIDLENEPFTPIGLYADQASEQKKQITYRGTLDGQGHTISNLKVEDVYYREAGLVSRLVGTVKNLGIVNADVSTNNNWGRAAAICGWKNGGNILNCYVIGDLVFTATEQGSNIGGPSAFYGGGSGTMRSCFTTYERLTGWMEGSEVNCFCLENTPDIIDELVTGKLCYKLNSQSFINPVWYQTIGQDEHPVLDSTHGIVYSTDENTFKSATPENFAEFRGDIIDRERTYCQEAIAYQGTIDEYMAEIDKWEAIETLPDFLAAFSAAQAVKAKVATSEKAYQAYIDACEKVRAQLAENDTQNEARDFLETYLDKGTEDEPGDYPNGNYAYILANHVLTDEQVAGEIDYANVLFNRFLISDPNPGTEMTVLLQNPQFTNGWNGWETENPSVLNIGGETKVMTIARGNGGAFTVQQTLTDLPNGIYALQVSSFAEVVGDPNLENHTGEIFLNGNHNFVMTPIEGMIPEDLAVDSVNCHLSDPNPDSYVQNKLEEPGYVPASLTGVSYAFAGGRYQNFVAVEVTDGKLTVGIRNRSYDFSVWQPFANLHLYYLGSADTAGEKLTEVLESYAARANTLMGIGYESTVDYDLIISKDLRAKLTAAVDKSQSEISGAEQIELVGTFSSLFDEVYDCRKAYLELGHAIEAFNEGVNILVEAGILGDEEAVNEWYERVSNAWDEYIGAEYSASEARAKAKEYSSVFGTLNQDEAGNYLIATPEDLVLFSLFVSADPTFPKNANALLTADLDMSSVKNFLPIGIQGAEYKGNFDGQGHTLTNLTVDKKGDYAGLFGVIGSGAVIQNLVVGANSTITASGRYAGLVGGTSAGGRVTLKNLGNEADVTCAGENAAGIIGVNAGNAATFIIINCYQTGKVQGGSDTALLTGWGGNNMTVTNCWCTGEVTGGLNGNYVYRVNNTPTTTNVFSLNGEQLGPGATKITEEDVTGGALTYTLNNQSPDGPWTQQLGTDPHPMLFGTAKVYACGSFQCDGVTPAEGTTVEYSNTEGTRTVAPHTLNEDRICTVCGDFDPELIIDGVYQIASAAQLMAFRNLPKMNSLSARLTADIDMNEQGWSGPTGYAGSFDGDGHTITNLGNTALFTTTANGAAIKNLTLTGGTRTLSKDSGTGVFVDAVKGDLLIENCVNETPITGTGWNWHAGGIVGQIDVAEVNVEIFGCTNKADIIITNEQGNYGNQIGGLVGFLTASRAKLTMTNCLNTGEVYSIGGASIGGIVAQTNNGYVTLRNCGNTGKITGRAGLNEAGPIMSHAYSAIGDLPVYITNCWNIGETVGNNAYRSLMPLLETNTHVTYSNCYDIVRTYEGETEGVTVITPEDAPSGALCYMLNEGADETIFYQLLGEDLYPVFDPTHMVVLKAADGTYYNVADGIETVQDSKSRIQNADAIYDLSGRRVEKPTRGIYIIGGKKVFVK